MVEGLMIVDFIRRRGIHLLLAVILVLILGPTAVPTALVDSINLAVTETKSGNPEKSLEHLKIALEIEPSLEDKLNTFAAQNALDAGLPEEAIRFLDPESTEGGVAQNCQITNAFLVNGDFEAGLDHLEKTKSTCPELVAVFHEAILRTIEEGNLPEIIDSLERLATLGMLPPAGWQTLGIVLAIDRPEEATAVLRLGRELGIEKSELALDLVRSIQEAEFSDHPSFLAASIGQTFIRHGEWEYASFALRKAVDQTPDFAEAWAYYGTSLSQLGEDGSEALKNALQLEPNNPTVQYLLAKHWVRTGNYDRAIRAYTFVAKNSAENAAILADLGAAYNLDGDTATALEYYRRAAEFDSNDPGFWLLLAYFSLEQGVEVLETGIPAARKVALMIPDQTPGGLDALGYGYYLADNPILAKRFLLRSIRANSERAETHYHLGLLYTSQGEFEAARGALSLAIQLDPEGRIGELARRSLINLDS